jgi:Ketopantoate reductase
VQDFVIITLKAHSLPGVVDAMQPLLGKHTAIVTGVNGIPYWYFYQHGGKFAGTRLASIDPDGSQWTRLGPERAIGCVLYPARRSSNRVSSSTCTARNSRSASRAANARRAFSSCTRSCRQRIRRADPRQYPR